MSNRFDSILLWLQMENGLMILSDSLSYPKSRDAIASKKQNNSPKNPQKTLLSLIRCNIALSLCIPSWDSKIFIFWQLFSKRLSLLNNKKGIVLYNFPKFFFAMYIYCKKYEIHQFSMRNLDGQVILTKVT